MTARAPTATPFLVSPSRWLVSAAVAVFAGAFMGLHALLPTEHARLALNDIAWCLASMLATLLLLRCSQRVARKERLAWRLLSLACLSWLTGQLIWTHYEVVEGALPTLPHWMQWFFSGYDLLFAAGLLAFPRPEQTRRVTPRHVGNLILIVCALGTGLIIALTEPALARELGVIANISIIARGIGLSAMLVIALYLIWSHHWKEMHQPLLLLMFGAGLHTATYIAYAHHQLVGDYSPGAWENVSWIVIFGAYCASAYERCWKINNEIDLQHEAVSRQERFIEAAMPALLIAIIVGSGWYFQGGLTERSATWATLPVLGFAIILGLREAWIQNQEETLLHQLHDANASLQLANRDLKKSDAHIRKMNAELEERVSARTAELQEAYRELENFSYAVAHDLKAPLRAVDGFGSMLAHEYADRLDDTGKHYLHRVRDNALKMAGLIDDLLAYARIDRRQLDIKALSLPEAIRRALDEQQDELAQRGFGVSVNVVDVRANADAAGLGIVLRNVLQNAIKFSKHATPPSIGIEVKRLDTGVLIAVCDNGIGFDMSYCDRIFEMFQRLHRNDEVPGTGIGLAIVRKAVERMGGKVWAESTPGNGATFFVHLPHATD